MEETEMEQLKSMGFNDELAAQALAATGGQSILKATEWILSHQPPPPPPPPPLQQQQQPKLDHFFPFNTKPTSNITPKTDPHVQKRPRTSSHAKPSDPLAERMRPNNIDQVIGQVHILGPTSLLGSAIKCNRLPSIVLWGPPGTGKTSIVKAISKSSALLGSYKFVTLSAVSSGVKDVRDAVDEARKLKDKFGKRTVLFIDEVHRFNKSQQDCFLPVIEDGSIVFIGATTENPSFHLVTPLLSRCRVLTLSALTSSDLAALLNRAVADLDKGVSLSVGMKVEVEDGVVEFLSSQCDGDARVALNALEVSAVTAAGRADRCKGKKIDVENGNESEKNFDNESSVSVVVKLEDAKEALQCKHLAYDKAGDEHYNLISALHKSMRGSDADAALYWLARMLEGGEQPLYIARRLVRFASEDVGLADPNAVVQAVACYQACHFIGMPECNVNLAQCVAYLALAPKSVAVYQAIKDAQKVVQQSVGGNEGVPLHLRNAPTKLMKDLGYGKGYVYTPDNPTAPQSFLPPPLIGRKFLDWPPTRSDA